MKGIVKIRNYDSINNMSPKQRGYNIEKLLIRETEIKTTVRTLFEANLLTLNMFFELEKIYMVIVNERGKYYYFPFYLYGKFTDRSFARPDIKNNEEHIKKIINSNVILHSCLHLQFSKEFKKRFKIQ